VNYDDHEKRARKVARLWASGLSVRQAAKRVGIHHQTALDDLAWLDRNSYYDSYLKRLRRRRVAARDQRMVSAVQLRTAGKSLRQIAAELGVSYQTVSNDLARWDAEHPNVISLVRNCQKVAREVAPRGAR
jgi:transposase